MVRKRPEGLERNQPPIYSQLLDFVKEQGFDAIQRGETTIVKTILTQRNWRGPAVKLFVMGPKTKYVAFFEAESPFELRKIDYLTEARDIMRARMQIDSYRKKSFWVDLRGLADKAGRKDLVDGIEEYEEERGRDEEEFRLERKELPEKLSPEQIAEITAAMDKGLKIVGKEPGEIKVSGTFFRRRGDVFMGVKILHNIAIIGRWDLNGNLVGRQRKITGAKFENLKANVRRMFAVNKIVLGRGPKEKKKPSLVERLKAAARRKRNPRR